MPYWLEIPSHVRRQIDNLPNYIRPRIQKVIVSLGDNPRPKAALALDGALIGYYRIRVELYRIIYTIHKEFITIEITRVAKHDHKTYENLR